MTYGVITVTLNAGRTIAKTIDSVIAQTLRPSQYVFVDGGSTDDTLKVIELAVETLSALNVPATLVRQSSKGITSAWNLGIREIGTDLVFILNGDDWYEPDAAAHVISAFKRHPDTDMLLARGRYFDLSGSRAPVVCKPRPAWVLPVAMTAIHPACFVRRQLYERIGLFDESYAIVADYEFVYRCVKRKVAIRTSDCVVVNVLEGGTAAQQRRRAREEMAEIGRRYSKVPALPSLALHVRRFLDR
jgi:glycosyltransferase involved in cell wall biosynthesis